MKMNKTIFLFELKCKNSVVVLYFLTLDANNLGEELFVLE